MVSTKRLMVEKVGSISAWKELVRSVELLSMHWATSMDHIQIAVSIVRAMEALRGKRYSSGTMMLAQLTWHLIPLTHKRSTQRCGTFGEHPAISTHRRMDQE